MLLPITTSHIHQKPTGRMLPIKRMVTQTAIHISSLPKISIANTQALDFTVRSSSRPSVTVTNTFHCECKFLNRPGGIVMPTWRVPQDLQRHSSSRNLQGHMRLKHGKLQDGEESEYRCLVTGCTKIFKRQDSRLKHIRKKHPNLGAAAPKARK